VHFRGLFIKISGYFLALVKARLINSNTGSSCEISSSVAIPWLVLPALVMAADGLGLPSVSLNTARFPFFALLRH
jgi:hypothetical protein